MNVYVYYDVPLAAVAATLDRVTAMQAALGSHARRVALLRRPETRPAGQTWMEVYEDVAADFETRLAEAAATHGLVAATGPRHVERFVPIVGCA